MNIEKRLAEIRARKVEIREVLEKGEQVELEKIKDELEKLELEEKSLEERKNIMEGINLRALPEVNQVEKPKEKKGKEMDLTISQRIQQEINTEDYRHAFMRFVQTGQRSAALEQVNMLTRSDETTTTTESAALIPTAILNKVVEKMEDYGRIYAKITKTNIQGGVQVPISDAKPTASWVSEGSVANTQAKDVSSYISFSYFKLQVRVGQTLISNVVTLSAFEQVISENIYEAMITAIEESVIKGAGTTEPLGIINDSDIPAANVIEVTAAEFKKYETWTKIKGTVPRKYRSGVVIIMNDTDWTSYIEGMVDANGQPVARTTQGLAIEEKEILLGKEVIPVEDYIDSIDDASAGDVVAILVRLKDYMFNTNMAMTFRKYFDNDTDKWISKSTLIGDGKLADRNGVVLVKKK